MMRAKRGLRRAGMGAAALTLALLAACSRTPEPVLSSGPVLAMPVDQDAAGALVSQYRKAHGLGAVAIDPALQRVAQAQADAMAAANLLSHTVDGPLPDRLARVGRTRAASIENVSAGYPSLDAALGGWRRSAAHNANLLYPPMRRLGIAAAAAPGTRYKTFWSLVMTN